MFFYLKWQQSILQVHVRYKSSCLGFELIFDLFKHVQNGLMSYMKAISLIYCFHNVTHTIRGYPL